jgi:hypothetical protein
MHRDRIPYLDRGLPIISPRIEFSPFSAGLLPSITPRLDYDSIRRLVALRNPQESAYERFGEGTINNPTDILPLHSEVVATDKSPISASIEIFPKKKYKSPAGQPGRPNSGGYNLEQTLLRECNWTENKFQTVQVRARQIETVSAEEGARDRSTVWRKKR